MKWERPNFVEIGMNAEIGGYQSDFGDPEPNGPRGPILSADPKATESETQTSPFSAS
jgi:hypothetical protein